jgi:4-amino-4-deoxy-L-arabinose transferase-like glycosyltransferase
MNGEGPAERAAKKSRELTKGDDLLRGTAEQKLRGFYAIAFGASWWAWEVAFALGTHRTIFYYRRQELFVLSVVVLLSALLLRRRVHTRPWVLLFFLPPIALLLLRLVVPHPHGAVAQTADRLLNVATIAVVPFVAGIIVRLLAPNYFTLPDGRLKLTVAAIVATVALIGFLVGHFNDRFLTCEEFIVAGDDPAPNCAHGTER